MSSVSAAMPVLPLPVVSTVSLLNKNHPNCDIHFCLIYHSENKKKSVLWLLIGIIINLSFLLIICFIQLGFSWCFNVNGVLTRYILQLTATVWIMYTRYVGVRVLAKNSQSLKESVPLPQRPKNGLTLVVCRPEIIAIYQTYLYIIDKQRRYWW